MKYSINLLWILNIQIINVLFSTSLSSVKYYIQVYMPGKIFESNTP